MFRLTTQPLDKAARVTWSRQQFSKISFRQWRVYKHYKHQNVTHQTYHASLNAFSNNYENFTSKIDLRVEGRFSQNSHITFLYLPICQLLQEVASEDWTINEFRCDEIEALKFHLMLNAWKKKFLKNWKHNVWVENEEFVIHWNSTFSLVLLIICHNFVET